MIYLITGGARSGKTRYAQQLALSLSETPVYVATAKIWDEDFKKRVQRHQADRGPEWTSLEEEMNLHHLPLAGKVAVIDCVTLWLTNCFIHFKNDTEASLKKLQTEVDALEQMPGHFIIVSNELGMGLHAETTIGRTFTDLQGWANQYIAHKATKVILMVAGIPLTIKQ